MLVNTAIVLRKYLTYLSSILASVFSRVVNTFCTVTKAELVEAETSCAVLCFLLRFFLLLVPSPLQPMDLYNDTLF